MTSDSSTKPNSYSASWFECFHANVEESRISREIDFVCRVAPLPEFQNILDVCCGMGRHARALSQRGYAVTGMDRNSDAIAKACQLAGRESYVIADIRDYQPAPEAFDAIIVMGQSFGYFDETTNRDVLRRLALGIRKDGRIILDLWNPEFFKAHQGARDLETSRGIVRESKRVDGDRLFVQLTYPDGVNEKFEWQLFSPEQMERLADSAGLSLLVACSGFDSRNLSSPTDPRIQFVLERVR